MKPTLILIALAGWLFEESTAATLKYCKEANLQGDCRTVSVANDGACSKF
jgi:hypothetical protein